MLTKKEGQEEGKNIIKKKISASWEAIKSGFKQNWWIGLAALAVFGVIAGITAAINAHHKNTADGTAEEVNRLSNEIYKLNEKAKNTEYCNHSKTDTSKQSLFLLRILDLV